MTNYRNFGKDLIRIMDSEVGEGTKVTVILPTE